LVAGAARVLVGMARYVHTTLSGGTFMPNPKSSFLVRDLILNLLSEQEVESVSSAETRPHGEGEYFVDLEHPEKGVLKVGIGEKPRSSHILPQSAVREETWAAIIRQLGR
jgi:hypothetical protein